MSESINAIDVVYQTNVAIENKSMEQLAGEINTGYHQAENLARMSYLFLAEVGQKLIEVKGRLKHGHFENWCENNLEFSKSKAEKCMKLAKRMNDENSLFSKTETFTDIEISTVWALLAAPEEVAAEVIETHDVTDMTVRELKEEISRLKNEKAIVENNNDDIRKELARAQNKLAEAVTEEDYSRMQNEYVEAQAELEKELREAKAGAEEEIEKLNQKLQKAKEDLKKQKEKQKELETSKEEEIKKGIEEALPEIEKKAREEGAADAAATLAQNTEEIMRLTEEVEKLEAEKAKLSNNALMEFKLYVDQLQDIYYKINDIITEQNLHDEDLGAKMQTALQKIVEGWRP